MACGAELVIAGEVAGAVLAAGKDVGNASFMVFSLPERADRNEIPHGLVG
jgi:hypothetical protein